MILRRTILLVMLAAAMWACFDDPKSEVGKLDVKCPTGDRNDWTFTGPVAIGYTWIVLPRDGIEQPNGPCPNGFTICTIMGGWAFIYALQPEEMTEEFRVRHEKCHAEGYWHPTTPYVTR